MGVGAEGGRGRTAVLLAPCSKIVLVEPVEVLDIRDEGLEHSRGVMEDRRCLEMTGDLGVNG